MNDKTPRNNASREWMNTFDVFIGGIIGTGIRAGFSFLQPDSWNWPWVTFLINVIGAFILGFLTEIWASLPEENSKRRHTSLIIGTGVLGGFTTYGTFISEVSHRFAHGLPGWAIAYAIVSVVVGALFAWWGFLLAELVQRSISTKKELETIKEVEEGYLNKELPDVSADVRLDIAEAAEEVEEDIEEAEEKKEKRAERKEKHEEKKEKREERPEKKEEEHEEKKEKEERREEEEEKSKNNEDSRAQE